MNMTTKCAICGTSTQHQKHRLVCQNCLAGNLPDGTTLPDGWQNEAWAKVLLQSEKTYRNMQRRDHRHDNNPYTETFATKIGDLGDEITVDGWYLEETGAATSIFQDTDEYAALLNLFGWNILEDDIRPSLTSAEASVFDICMLEARNPYFNFKKPPISKICEYLNISEEAAYKRMQRLQKKINQLLEVSGKLSKNVQF